MLFLPEYLPSLLLLMSLFSDRLVLHDRRTGRPRSSPSDRRAPFHRLQIARCWEELAVFCISAWDECPPALILLLSALPPRSYVSLCFQLVTHHGFIPCVRTLN
jgi:hypothetical protein